VHNTPKYINIRFSIDYLMRGETICFLILLILFSGCISTGKENLPPEPIANVSPEKINVGSEATFDANGSRDRDGRIVRYHWDFGDGESSDGKVVKHVYTVGGNYTVILTITDNEGKKNIKKIFIYVNFLPKAIIEAKKKVKIYESAKFYGKSSYDIDGNITKYYWDFGDGKTSTDMDPEHSFENIGNYNVSLVVYDDFGAKDSAIILITVVLRNYTVSWNEASATYSKNGYLKENSTTNISIEVSYLNLTKVVFKLLWEDRIYPILREPNDLFSLKVLNYKKEINLIEGMNESLVLIYSIAQKPAELNVKAKSIEEVRKIVGDNYTSSEGIGKWEAEITLIDAGDGIIIPDGIVRDDGNSWELLIEYTYYEKLIKEEE
ncbi:MAG: PKD domain-containing protein, partial [Candidatus Thermoplasmatota archaeon]